MGKVSNILYMIDLLNTGNIYTIKELSKEIGVSERMIRYYREEISKNGIAIESFKGPGGGYFLIDRLKNYININKYDIKLLENILDILRKDNYRYLDKYEDFLDKIKKMRTISEEKSKYITNINLKKPDNILSLIKDTIIREDKLKIIYLDIDGSRLIRTIHPLELFMYHEEYYVTAFCELRNDIRHFELKRIESIIET